LLPSTFVEKHKRCIREKIFTKFSKGGGDKMKIKNEHSPKFIGTGCSYLIVLLKQRRFFSKFTCASLIPEIFPNKKGGGGGGANFSTFQG